MPLPEDTALCTSVHVLGCFTPTPSPRPTLLFRFTHEDGTELPPIALVLDETEAIRFGPAVGAEAHRAIGAARSVRRLS